MDRSPDHHEWKRRAEKSREELPDILDAEVHQHLHGAALDAVRWVEDQARQVQNLVPPKPRNR